MDSKEQQRQIKEMAKAGKHARQRKSAQKVIYRIGDPIQIDFTNGIIHTFNVVNVRKEGLGRIITLQGVGIPQSHPVEIHDSWLDGNILYVDGITNMSGNKYRLFTRLFMMCREFIKGDK